MREDFVLRLERELKELTAQDLRRSLYTYAGVDFGSNDYLGFAIDPGLKAGMLEAARGTALSSSSSRLLPGHHREHLAAEGHFAKFVGAERALFFNSGYDANLSLLTTLPTRHDLILYDERSHASIYEGVHSSVAQSQRFAHNSARDLSARLDRYERKGQVFVVLESVYSMDGDVADLREMKKVADRCSAILIIDEAHATGVFGAHGEGLVAESIGCGDSIITVHTCGKALGAAGAFVAGSKIVIEYLINKARNFIYTTALPPIVPLQIIRSIECLESDGAVLVAALGERSRSVRASLQEKLNVWQVPDGITPIVPIIIGPASDALGASRLLEERGFSVPAVRPPSVPEGSSRLRLNVSLRHSKNDLEGVVDAITYAESEIAT